MTLSWVGSPVAAPSNTAMQTFSLLFIPPSVDLWAVPAVWLLWVSGAAMSLCVYVLVSVYVFNSLGHIFSGRIAGSRNSMLTFSIAAKTFSIPTNDVQGFQFLHLANNLTFYYYSHPSRCDVVSHLVLTYPSWMTANAKHLFMCLWVISIPSVEECLFR